MYCPSLACLSVALREGPQPVLIPSRDLWSFSRHLGFCPQRLRLFWFSLPFVPFFLCLLIASVKSRVSAILLGPSVEAWPGDALPGPRDSVVPDIRGANDSGPFNTYLDLAGTLVTFEVGDNTTLLDLQDFLSR